MTNSYSDEKFCDHCASVKPIAEFRRRSRNGTARLNQCRACHAQAERNRRASVRTTRGKRRMAKCLTEIKNERNNTQLELACVLMFRQFGGLEGFMVAWADYYEQARQKGGFAAFRCLQSVLRLAQYCDENQPDLGGISDEELQSQLAEYIRRMIEQRPDLALSAAKAMGWNVIPPTPATTE